MSLQEGGSDYRPPDISLHPSSTTKGKTREGYISTWDLVNKQTGTNNQTSKIMYEIDNLNRFCQTIQMKV